METNRTKLFQKNFAPPSAATGPAPINHDVQPAQIEQLVAARRTQAEKWSITAETFVTSSIVHARHRG